MIRLTRLTALLLSAAASLLAAAGLPRGAFAEVTAEQTPEGVAIKIDGEPFTQYLVESGTKPILWPILGPGGVPMTRAFPMENVKGEAKDHIHQRSCWFTHGSVNGVDFWAEIPRPAKGKIKHREFVAIESGPQALVVTRNDWLGPDDQKICEDERRMVFGRDGSTRWIDFDLRVRASEGEVTFGDTKEGSFGVRVAAPLEVQRKKGGRIVNNLGQTDGEAWGQAAAWVDYHGLIDDKPLGVAVFNHPSSFRYPTYWHVRDYGLLAANPFGLHDFQRNDEVDGSFRLAAGETLNLRYRLLLHEGDHQQAGLAEAFEKYAAGP